MRSEQDLEDNLISKGEKFSIEFNKSNGLETPGRQETRKELDKAIKEWGDFKAQSIPNGSSVTIPFHDKSFKISKNADGSVIIKEVSTINDQDDAVSDE